MGAALETMALAWQGNKLKDNNEAHRKKLIFSVIGGDRSVVSQVAFASWKEITIKMKMAANALQATEAKHKMLAGVLMKMTSGDAKMGLQITLGEWRDYLKNMKAQRQSEKEFKCIMGAEEEVKKRRGKHEATARKMAFALIGNDSANTMRAAHDAWRTLTSQEAKKRNVIKQFVMGGEMKNIEQGHMFCHMVIEAWWNQVLHERRDRAMDDARAEQERLREANEAHRR